MKKNKPDIKWIFKTSAIPEDLDYLQQMALGVIVSHRQGKSISNAAGRTIEKCSIALLTDGEESEEKECLETIKDTLLDYTDEEMWRLQVFLCWNDKGTTRRVRSYEVVITEPEVKVSSREKNSGESEEDEDE